jgi:hypothetical protein
MNNNIFENVIKTLETETKELISELPKLREKDDTNTYFNKIKILKETLDMLKKYEDYTLKGVMERLGRCWHYIDEENKIFLAKQIANSEDAETIIALIKSYNENL